jgi:hypothetical protein
LPKKRQTKTFGRKNRGAYKLQAQSSWRKKHLLNNKFNLHENIYQIIIRIRISPYCMSFFLDSVKKISKKVVKKLLNLLYFTSVMISKPT